MSLKYSSLCNFLEDFEKDRLQLFSKCLIELTGEAIWSWTFCLLKIFNHSFNFIIYDWFVHIFMFRPCSVLEGCTFLKMCPLFQVGHFGVHVVSYGLLYLVVVSGACVDRGFLGLEVDKHAQMGAPPSAHGGMRLAGREGGCRGGTSLARHSAMIPCFCGDPEKCFYSFFQKSQKCSVASSENIPSCGTPYSCCFMLSFHSQQLSPPWVHFPSLSPCPHQETQDSGWGMQAAAQIMGTILALSCLSQASCCTSHHSCFCPS